MPKRGPKRKYVPINVATLSGIAASDEALYASELEAIEQEQADELKLELREYEAIVRAERLYQ